MVLLDGVVPYYTANLRERLMGISTTLSARTQASYEIQMSQLVVRNYSGNEIRLQCRSIFREVIHGDTTKSFVVCLGDLSCTCNENETDVCMHVEKAIENTGLDIGLIRTTSTWISIVHNEDTISLEDIIDWPEKQCIEVKRHRQVNKECETQLKDTFLMDANMPCQRDMSQPIVHSRVNHPLESVLSDIRKYANRIVDPAEKAGILAGLHSFLNSRILPKVPTREPVAENQERYRSHDDPSNRIFRPRQQRSQGGGHSNGTLGKRQRL